MPSGSRSEVTRAQHQTLEEVMKPLFAQLFALVLCASAACAQIGVRRGVPQNCHGILTAHLAGGAAVGGDLPACAPYVVDDLVTTLGESANETSLPRLARIIQVAGAVRDPRILAAALALASNRAASDPARTAGLLVALSQHRLALAPSSVTSYEEALTAPARAGCMLNAPAGPTYWVDHALPSDYRDQVSRVVSDVVADSSAPPVVSALARCAKPYLDAVRGGGM
jgi:hypothetical protein